MAVGVSRSPLSRTLRNPREIDRTTGVSYGKTNRVPPRAPRRVDTSTLAGVAAASGQTVPSGRMVMAGGPQGVRPIQSGYSQTDANRFMEAMRADTGGTQGYAFGGGYDPLMVPDQKTGGANWQAYVAAQAEQAERDRQDAAAAEAARQQAAAAAAERARVAGVYGGQISELEAALGGVGGVYAPMLQQIADLYGGQEQGVRDLYAGYGTQLAEMGTAAQGRIDTATAQAMARLAGIDPEAGAFQWNVQAGGVPQAAAANYLQAIGASPAEVDAARMLGESLIAQQLGTASQLSAGTQAGLDRERAARQAASTLLAQQATGGLSAQQAAYGAQLSAGELARVQALQASGLSETQALQLAQREEEERIRNAILQARLDAAAAGVSL